MNLISEKPQRIRQWLLVALLIALCGTVVQVTQAQDASATCASTASQILATVNTVCGEVGRDQLCYGNVSVEASPSDFASGFTFEQEGDLVSVADIATLRLQTRNFNNLEWGVALAKLQVTDDTGLPQDVTLLLFGNIELDNSGADLIEVPGVVSATDRIIVRIGPSRGGADAGRLEPGQAIAATGIFTNEFNEQWIRIAFDEAPGGIAWVQGVLLDIEGGVDALPVLETSDNQSSAYGPMQAFTFSSGAGVDGCGQEAESGLLVQTPAGVGEVNFLINEIDFQIGSDALIQTMPNEEMRITTLEGNVRTTAQGVTRSIPGGTRGTIPLDEEGRAAGTPQLPEPIELDEIEAFEVFEEGGFFEETFEVVPFEEGCLEEYNDAFNADGGSVGSASGDCVGEYYDAFVDEFLEDLPDECFGDEGNVFGGCLDDVNEIVIAECESEDDPFCDEFIDEDGDFTGYDYEDGYDEPQYGYSYQQPDDYDYGYATDSDGYPTADPYSGYVTPDDYPTADPYGYETPYGYDGYPTTDPYGGYPTADPYGYGTEETYGGGYATPYDYNASDDYGYPTTDPYSGYATPYEPPPPPDYDAPTTDPYGGYQTSTPYGYDDGSDDDSGGGYDDSDGGYDDDYGG